MIPCAVASILPAAYMALSSHISYPLPPAPCLSARARSLGTVILLWKPGSSEISSPRGESGACTALLEEPLVSSIVCQFPSFYCCIPPPKIAPNQERRALHTLDRPAVRRTGELRLTHVSFLQKNENNRRSKLSSDAVEELLTFSPSAPEWWSFTKFMYTSSPI